jgi:hypothetical protein
MLNIRRAAVIGAGNMGAQIAAHLANVGIPSLLMDVPPTELAPDEQEHGLTLQKWGFNFELGPFETWDALGVRETASRLEKEGREVPRLVRDLLAAGKTSFYEPREARRFYFDVCGGDLSSLHFVSEQYLLDLEREVFLSLCGEPKTVERIRHTLKTGKPLRN